MAVKTIETYVEVDVDLDDFTDDELLDELELRGVERNTKNVSVEELYDIWRFNRNKFEDAFRAFCRETIGRSF